MQVLKTRQPRKSKSSKEQDESDASRTGSKAGVAKGDKGWRATLQEDGLEGLEDGVLVERGATAAETLKQVPWDEAGALQSVPTSWEIEEAPEGDSLFPDKAAIRTAADSRNRLVDRVDYECRGTETQASVLNPAFQETRESLNPDEGETAVSREDREMLEKTANAYDSGIYSEDEQTGSDCGISTEEGVDAGDDEEVLKAEAVTL